MGDPRIDSVKQTGGSVGAPSIDDQAIDILNNPRLSENDKRKELEKAFSELPDDEKTAMYDRLKPRNNKDPLNKAFHYRLSHGGKPGNLSTVDRILKTLNPDHGNQAAAGQSSTQAPKTPAPKTQTSTKLPSNRAVDDKTMQAVRDYKPAEPKTDFGPQIRTLVQDSNKSPLTKVAETRAKLEMASKDDFKKMVMESATQWSPNARDFVTEAMRESPAIMARIAKEFTPDEQTAVIKRTYDNSDVLGKPYNPDLMHREGMEAWMKNTSDAALNQVLRETRSNEALSNNPRGYALIKRQIESGNSDVFKKLDVRNQTELMKMVVDDPGMKSSFVQIQHAFSVAKDKNAIIDHFQKENPELLPALLHRMPGIGNELLEGVNKENAQFLRETLLNMADRQPDKGMADEYRKRAHFIKGWIEEAFK